MKTDDLWSSMSWEQKMKLVNLGSLNNTHEPAEDEYTPPAMELSRFLPKKVELEPMKEPDYLKLMDLKPKPMPKPDRLLYPVEGLNHIGRIDINHRIRDISGRDTGLRADVLDIVRNPKGEAIGQVNCLGQIEPPPMIPSHMMPPPPMPQGFPGGY